MKANKIRTLITQSISNEKRNIVRNAVRRVREMLNDNLQQHRYLLDGFLTHSRQNLATFFNLLFTEETTEGKIIIRKQPPKTRNNAQSEKIERNNSFLSNNKISSTGNRTRVARVTVWNATPIPCPIIFYFLYHENYHFSLNRFSFFLLTAFFDLVGGNTNEKECSD